MTKIKISTFNVNSVKARLPRVLEWLKKSQPDIILLQELKCTEQDFPFEAFFDAGYNCAVSGQKTYNGVAILSKFKIEDVTKNLSEIPDRENHHPAARYIEAMVTVNKQALRVSSIYVPNGGGEIVEGETLENSEKFRYKLDFFDKLHAHLAQLLTYNEMAIFGGDFNVAAQNIDVYNPAHLEGSVCFHSAERQKFRAILNLGLHDIYRELHPQQQAFSWWDYRGGGWQHNKGMRIDYLLASPALTDKIHSATIEDKGVRDQEKASDHCPVSVVVNLQ